MTMLCGRAVGLVIMRDTGCPIVLDATHSVRHPGGLFKETHPDPANAMSDGPNAWPLGRLPALARDLAALDTFVKAGFAATVSA